MNVFHFIRTIDKGIAVDAKRRSITQSINGNMIRVEWRWEYQGVIKCIKHNFARSCFYTAGLRQEEEPIKLAVEYVREVFDEIEAGNEDKDDE